MTQLDKPGRQFVSLLLGDPEGGYPSSAVAGERGWWREFWTAMAGRAGSVGDFARSQPGKSSGQFSAVADTSARIQIGDRLELSSVAATFLRDRDRRGRATTVLPVLSVLLVFAVVVASFALVQQSAVEEQLDVVKQQRTVVEKQRDVAVSRQVAGQALELRSTNPALAAQLSLAAYRLASTIETRSSLLSISATRLTGHTDVSPASVMGPAVCHDLGTTGSGR